MYSIQTIDQQRAARKRAPRRYKNLNAATVYKVDLAACFTLIIALALATMIALTFNEPTAKPGKIYAKSEMTKAELKTLQLMPERKP